METKLLKVTQVVGDEFCVASEDGERVYTVMVEALRSGQLVHLSFEGVRDLTSSFLNAAIGQLYGIFPEEELRRKLLPPKDIETEDLVLLQRVVETAKSYFKDQDKYRQNARDILDEND